MTKGKKNGEMSGEHASVVAVAPPRAQTVMWAAY